MIKLYILTKIENDIKMTHHNPNPEVTLNDSEIKSLQKEALQQNVLAWIVYIN